MKVADVEVQDQWSSTVAAHQAAWPAMAPMKQADEEVQGHHDFEPEEGEDTICGMSVAKLARAYSPSAWPRAWAALERLSEQAG